jgi:hypothetical protein
MPTPLGVTVAVISVALTTFVLETGTFKPTDKLEPVDTPTVLTGHPDAADESCVMKPVPVMVMG